MHINPPDNVRKALYIITSVMTPIIAYLALKGIIGDLEVALWTAEVAVVSAMAAFNTPSASGN